MSKFLKVLVNSILILAIIVAGGLLIPPFAGVTTVIVDDEGMDTNLSMGSVTYAIPLKGNPGKGSKVLLNEGDSQYVYKVQSVDGNNCTLEDKLSTDGGTIEHTVSATMKKVILTVPFIGYVSMALRTTEGLIIVGLSVVFVIILFILAEIWKKDDAEDDEDDEEEDAEEDDEEDDDDAEEVPLSRREQKKQKKAQAKREKAEAKAAKKAEKKGKKNSEEKIQEDTEESTPAKEKNLFEETESILAADIAQMMNEKEESLQEVQELDQERGEGSETEGEEMFTEVKESVLPTVEEEALENNHFAIPSYTKDELIHKAKEAGDDPEVVEDEISGVTLLDYSDIL